MVRDLTPIEIKAICYILTHPDSREDIIGRLNKIGYYRFAEQKEGRSCSKLEQVIEALGLDYVDELTNIAKIGKVKSI